MIQPLLEARAKYVKNFVGFLEYGRTWYFAFEIYWPLVLTLKFEILQVEILCNFVELTLPTIFKKEKKNFAHENIKKLPSKVAYLWQFGFFFSASPTAQNSPELKIHIRNVAQDTSLYYSVRPWRNFFSASTANLQGNVCHILLPLWKVNRNDHN